MKMLMVCIDICIPELRLLHDRCEVGVGAADPMRKMLEEEGLIKPKVKRDVGQTDRSNDGVVVERSISGGVCCVKRHGKQLIQVTRGMAGTLDRANAIAEDLAKLAVQKKLGPEHQEILKKRRHELFGDCSFKVPYLGLDAKMQEHRERVAAGQVTCERRSDGPTPAEALGTLCKRINDSDASSAAHFWRLLAQVEAHARKHFQALGLVVSQMKTQPRNLSAVTLQVQLCEFRQFEKFLRKPGLKRPREEL